MGAQVDAPARRVIRFEFDSVDVPSPKEAAMKTAQKVRLTTTRKRSRRKPVSNHCGKVSVPLMNTHVAGESAVQQIILAQIESSLSLFDGDIYEAIFHSKALPRKTANTLSAALFLSRSVTKARIVQDWTGVPSSILLALAHYDRGPLTEQAFMERAMRLKGNPRFSNFMEAKDAETRLRLISTCEVWDRMEALEHIEFIGNNDLFELDYPMQD
jgi:tRNA U38,U39,U40 pseudouridine synthase TruA